jgi:hypothetical protein
MIHDSPEWRKARDAKLLEWFGGNQSAVEFVLALSTMAELWDDLTDKDKELSPQDIQSAMWAALVTLPNNEFFNTHKNWFMPLIVQAMNSYEDSVELEQGSTNDRAYALTLRIIALQISSMVVLLLRGREAARACSVEMWKYFTAHDDAVEWIEKKKGAV